MNYTVTILGCGSSGGVPRAGQGWGACNPDNPKNRRRRCSILVEGRAQADGPSTNVLVDVGPDLREQLISAGTERLDGVLITHAHADHVHGIDDVRPLVIKAHKRIPVFMDDVTTEVVTSRFNYIFATPPGSQYPPLMDAELLTPGRKRSIAGPGGDIEAIPFTLDHGDIPALGFRFGSFAYTPDVVGIPEDAVRWLENLDLWIIDALRYTRHPSHFSLAEALEWIDRMKPRRAVLTNLHTDLDYDRLVAELPEGVTPAYDGMTLTVI